MSTIVPKKSFSKYGSTLPKQSKISNSQTIQNHKIINKSQLKRINFLNESNRRLLNNSRESIQISQIKVQKCNNSKSSHNFKRNIRKNQNFKSVILSMLPLLVAYFLFFFLTSHVDAYVSISCPPVNLIHRLALPNGATTATHHHLSFDSSSTHHSSSSNNNHHNHHHQSNHTTPECDCTTIQEGGWEINCYSNQPSSDTGRGDLSASSLDDDSSKNSEFSDYALDYNILMVSFTIKYLAGRQVMITCDHGSPAFKPALFQGFGIEMIDTFVISNCELPTKLPLSLILQRTTTTSSDSQPSPSTRSLPPSPPLTVATSHFSFKMGSSEFSVNNSSPIIPFSRGTSPSSSVYQSSHPAALSQTVTVDSSPLSSQEYHETISSIRSLYLTSKRPVTVQQLNTLLSGLESLEELTLSDFTLTDIHDFVFTPSTQHLSLSDTFNLSFPSSDLTVRSKRDTQSRFIHAPPTTEIPETLFSSSFTTINPLRTVAPHSSPPPSSASTIVIQPKIASNNTSTLIEVIPKLREERVLALPEMDLTFRPKDENGVDELTEIQPTTMAPDFIISENTEMSSFPDESKDEEKDKEDEKDKSEESEISQVPKLNEDALSLARLMPNLTVLRLRSFVIDPKLPPIFFQILKNLTNLEYLELDSNIITEIPKHALSFAPNLRKLYLFKNSIQTIQSEAFKNLSLLEILDLSHNRLTLLPDNLFEPLKSLSHLSLRNNKLMSLESETFSSNDKLIALDLSQNVGLEALPGKIFDRLEVLTNLSLAFCNMSEISDDFGRLLKSVPKLIKLDLKSNRLTNLTVPGLFGSNPNLIKLDISNNQIRVIAPSIFSSKNSTRLEELYLSKNRLNALPDALFNSVKNLKILHISQNELTEINPMLFIQLRSLEDLNLSRNLIKTLNTNVNQLPFGIGSSLRTIDLSYNQLTEYEEDIGNINWSLYLTIAELNLRGNQFTGTLTIPSFSSSLEPVVVFDVSSNRFSHVSTQNLHQFETEDWRELKPEMTQSANSYETQVKIESNPFHCDCFLFTFINYTRMSYRSGQKVLGRRTYFELNSLSAPACHEPKELNEFPLSSLELGQLRCRIDDQRICPSRCKCEFRAQDSAAIINCDDKGFHSIPEELQISQFFNVSVQEIGGAIISDVKNVEISLKNNSISDVGPLSKMFHWNNGKQAYMPEAIIIDLDYNEISSLPSDLLDMPTITGQDSQPSRPRIKRFSLIGNEIRKVPIKLLKQFSGDHGTEADTNDEQSVNTTNAYGLVGNPISDSSKLFLGDNPINCFNEPASPEVSCWIRDFKHWITTHPQMIGDVGSIRCSNISNYGLPENVTEIDDILINISDHILCPILIPDSDSAALIALSVACVVLGSSLFVVSILYYRNKQTILAFIYIHLNPVFICLSFTEDDLDEDKIYDAFVSYSSADRDIVMQLIEKLEAPKDMSEINALMSNGKTVHEASADRVVPEYEFRSTLKSSKDLELGNIHQNDSVHHKLCIHERDWLPGNLISWNIVNSVQNSRRTILILSEQFIQSIWFQVEFHTAYYQMLEDKMDRLIVIVRGELPPKERLDKDLIYLLTTKTYLVWGEKWFWEKLYYALPHKRKANSATEFGKNARSTEQNKFAITNGSTQKYGAVNGKWQNGSGNRSEVMKDYVDQTIATHFQLNELNSGLNGSNIRNSNIQTNNLTSAQFVQPDIEPKPIRNAPKSLRNSGTLATASPATLQAFSASGAYDNKTFIDETGT